MKVALAFLLDLFIGDPRYPFHPIRIMGKLARRIESRFNTVGKQKLKGFFCAFFLYGITGTVCFALVSLLEKFSFGLIVEVILIYTTIALHDLLKHGYRVYRLLKKGQLEKARVELSYMVGRKTDDLDEKEMMRALIESLSENLVDGVTAPLFYAVLFGLPGAFVYKMINTLDSLWGHKNERFINFGYTAAKVDDLANYLPARLTAPLIIFVGSFFSFRFKKGMRILFRDGRKHPSPNSGLSEAAMAGILGVRLGGPNQYAGYISERPFVGNWERPLMLSDISKTFKICFLVSLTFLGFVVFTAETFNKFIFFK